MSGNWATSSPGEADWAVLLIHCGHRRPQFELQFASSGWTFPGGMSHRMSSPGACFGLSLTDGNGGCGTGTCYRGCWQLNTNRIWPCYIFINSGTALWGVQVEGVLSVSDTCWPGSKWVWLNGAKTHLWRFPSWLRWALQGPCSSSPVPNGRVMMDLVKLGDVVAAEQHGKIKRDKFRSDWCLG